MTGLPLANPIDEYMKHFLPVLFVLALFFSACDEKTGPETTEPTVELSVTELSFDEAASATKFVTVTASGPWTVVSREDWIHVNPASGSGIGSVSVSVDANTGDGAREGKITISTRTAAAEVTVRQDGGGRTMLTPAPAAFDGVKRASTTYQLLVYSFADSDGDGIGDFKGIEQRLDYLDELGVTALWLSPIHPSDSYHGYDVRDYYAVNPLFGTEADFKSLVDAAHRKGIAIYIDYVLNHSGKGNAWFTEALADPSSPYRDYYFFSTNPSADYKTFPMLSGTTYSAGEWKQAVTGSPKLTVTKTDEPVRSGDSSWNLWLWQDGGVGLEPKFSDNGDGTLSMVADLSGDWGLLVRKYPNWNAGSKFGAKAGNTILKADQPMDLVPDGADIRFSGNGRYRITISDYETETLYYMGAFSDWMPDLNYGALADLDGNACFEDLVASAEKWIGLGIDGFRLDAVKHICGGIASYNNTANQQFLAKWYERCNAAFKAAGHDGDIFMVGEAWSSHNDEKYYYRGINSCFEFGYWPLLYKALTGGNAASYVSSVSGFISEHKAVRSDAQTALFLTNHDHSSQTGGGEVRAADDLGKDPAKEKQAAAMLLTSPGKPFVYQGEELGYWGNSAGRGDEYLRAPIVWDAAATQLAAKGVNDRVDRDMLTGAISVEKQRSDAASLLNVYKTWSRLRNTYTALSDGEMSQAPGNGGSIAAWYMTAGNQRLLVIHNVGASQQEVAVSDAIDKPVAVLGGAFIKNDKLYLEASSSVVFEL